MLVLALDTSTEVCTVALLREGVVLAEVSSRGAARHGEELLPHIEHVLRLGQSRLEEVALFGVGVGPGSFTGLRVGLATVKGLALGLDRPVLGVSSLRALAQGASPGHAPVLAALNAHKDEVYAGLYVDGEERSSPAHAAPEEIAARTRLTLGDREVLVVGDAARVYGARLTAGLGLHRIAAAEHEAPRAAVIGRLCRDAYLRGERADVAELVPDYLRASDAKLAPA